MYINYLYVKLYFKVFHPRDVDTHRLEEAVLECLIPSNSIIAERNPTMNSYIKYAHQMKESGQGAEATAYLLEKASAGDVDAMEALCDSYCYGNLGEKSYEKSIYWGQKAIDNGSVRSQEILGIQYLNGYGVAVDVEKALVLLQQAVAGGCMKAGRFVGLYYMEKNLPEEAKKWFLEAANRGDITSQYHMGVLYENGIGVEADLNEAIRWYKLSAQRGDRIAKPATDALARLGCEGDANIGSVPKSV
ncbi:MAG: sel1 repeat family protein [Clostridiales bacterium]|nr:sel1 repeat family protein [Clostridiales bacterium]